MFAIVGGQEHYREQVARVPKERQEELTVSRVDLVAEYT